MLSAYLKQATNTISNEEVNVLWGAIDILEAYPDLHIELKKCTKCGNWRPATDKFWRREPRSADGLKYWCNKCLNKKRGQQAKKARQKKAAPWIDQDMAQVEEFRRQHEAAIAARDGAPAERGPETEIDPITAAARKMMEVS